MMQHRLPALELSDLVQRLDGAKSYCDSGISLKGLSGDSRQIRDGELFCAIRGFEADGNRFVDDALKRGAAAVLSEAPPREKTPWIQSADARRDMALSACEIFNHPSREISLIGVTGTNGKTTLVHILRDALTGLGKKAGAMGTLGAEWDGGKLESARTTLEAPDFQKRLRAMVDDGVETVACEVSSHALDLQRVTGTTFAGAVFTNLSRDHLDYHKTMSGYTEAKARLFAMLPKTTWAAVNSDDPAAAAMTKATSAKVWTFGLHGEAQVRAHRYCLGRDGMVASIRCPEGEYELKSELLGEPNLYNLLAAATALLAMKFPAGKVFEALSQARPVRGRFEKIETKRGFSVLVDYAHTPGALESLLVAVRALSPSRILTVFGCGGDRDKGKRALMGQAAASLSDFVFITSDNPRSEDPEKILDAIEPAVQNCKTKNEYRRIVLREEAIHAALEEAGEGDIVVIAGKGHETYQILGKKTIDFDDCEVARNWLASHASKKKMDTDCSWEDIAAALKGRWQGEPPGTQSPYKGLSIDSRTLRAGELFFAIEGPNFDGHDFIQKASGRGAVAAVVRHKIEGSQLPLIAVDDTAEALGRLGTWFRFRYPGEAAGVTGSAGKTTTKDLLGRMLSNENPGSVLISKGNLNNLFGLPLCLAGRRPSERKMVCEMGVSTLGEMDRLAALYQPDLMVFTNAGPVHLENFKTVENVAREKCSALKHLHGKGRAVVNADDPVLMEEVKDFQGELIRFAINAPADHGAENIKARGYYGSHFDWRHPGGLERGVDMPLPGGHNVMNFLAAAAAATAMGVAAWKCVASLEGLQPASGRGRMFHYGDDFSVIDESYNANPQALKKALEAFRVTRVEGRRILVLGDMLELGADEAAFHEAGGQAAVQLGIHVLISAGPLAACAAEAARAEGLEQVITCSDSEEAGDMLCKTIAPGDVALIKGSRGMAMERVIEVLDERVSRKKGEKG